MLSLSLSPLCRRGIGAQGREVTSSGLHPGWADQGVKVTGSSSAALSWALPVPSQNACDHELLLFVQCPFLSSLSCCSASNILVTPMLINDLDLELPLMRACWLLTDTLSSPLPAQTFT